MLLLRRGEVLWTEAVEEDEEEERGELEEGRWWEGERSHDDWIWWSC